MTDIHRGGLLEWGGRWLECSGRAVVQQGMKITWGIAVLVMLLVGCGGAPFEMATEALVELPDAAPATVDGGTASDVPVLAQDAGQDAPVDADAGVDAMTSADASEAGVGACGPGCTGAMQCDVDASTMVECDLGGLVAVYCCPIL